MTSLWREKNWKRFKQRTIGLVSALPDRSKLNLLSVKSPEPEEIQDLLYNKEDGFLIKYHFKRGLDVLQLDKLYEILECLKADWRDKKEVPKAIMYHIVTITPVLYRDLQLYSDYGVLCCQYEELIDKLDIAIGMCLNPDTNDIHFNKPLKEL